MKKIKLFSIVAAFVAAFAFTSCNTGDDNNSYYQPLTQAEKQACYLKTSGSRMSQLAYVSDEHVTEKDGKKGISRHHRCLYIYPRRWQRYCNDC